MSALTELRSRATAAELALIEKTAALLKEDRKRDAERIKFVVVEKVLEFCQANPPPRKDGFGDPRERYSRLAKYLRESND